MKIADLQVSVYNHNYMSRSQFSGMLYGANGKQLLKLLKDITTFPFKVSQCNGIH
jgi:hypothetical protein